MSLSRLIRAAAAASCILPSLLRAQPAKTGAARSPNIVILLADDIGYHDLGVQGMRDIATPNLDRLAREGVRFTDGYMVSPVCSPSRAGILTGRYPERWGQELNPGLGTPRDSAFGIPRTQPLLSERLKTLGYATGVFGKWHEGYTPPNVPTARGFDEFFGFLGPQHRYKPSWLSIRKSSLWRGTSPVEERSLLTDAFAREAVRFIGANARRPFFLYVPFNAIHEPMVDDETRIDRVRAIPDKMRRRYASLLVGLDDAVGRILDELGRQGLTNNTIVFFMSDNGGPTAQTTSQNTPLRGVKAGVYEGGIRVPFLMKWPGTIPPGTTYQQPVSALDVVPTVITAASGKPCCPDIDGVDLLPFIRNERGSAAPHESLFWRLDKESAAREGPWKLVMFGVERSVQLFNLQSDIGEARDVAKQNPDVVQRLTRDYRAWESQMLAPKWGVEHWRKKRESEER